MYWESEYVNSLEVHGDKGPIKVIFDSRFAVMPSLGAVKEGDIIYPVSIMGKSLCVIARLPVERREDAFEYLYRETGDLTGLNVPEGTAVISKEKHGNFAVFNDGMGYTYSRGAHISCAAAIPRSVTRIINKDRLIKIPHLFHQEPVIRTADHALSGTHGSAIYPRMIPEDKLPLLRFGIKPRLQKPVPMLNGAPNPAAFRGFVRKASDETFKYLESLFEKEERIYPNMESINVTEQFIKDGGFDGCTFIDGGVCAAKGFKAAGVNAHIKANSQKNDMALIYCDKMCSAAALYTQNKVKGAPITVTKQHLADGKAQAVIVNSGNANTCNSNGIEIAEGACELTAKALGISADDVIVASTGVIGQKMSLDPFQKNIPVLKEKLSEKGFNDACTAIMTTDTRQKQFAVEFKLDGETCHLGGMSKGSGMINPNMATMLAFITTDVKISSEMLYQALKQINAITYNMVSVDGDTSTNDMVTILSSGYAENKEITEFNEDYNVFIYALHAVMMNLARETARDGEGATKLITCVVKNADTEETAKAVALSVINSALLKAAISAADANWGRVLCAMGYADADFDVERVSVDFASEAGQVRVCENGVGVYFSEDEAYKILSEDEVIILIDLHSGDNPAVAWGCDLTYDYVKINAEYRS